MDKLKILKIEVDGELPAGCPWCPFDRFNGMHDPCVVCGCEKSGYGYRPKGCKLVAAHAKRAEKNLEKVIKELEKARDKSSTEDEKSLYIMLINLLKGNEPN